jgi:hypothetical protein
VTAAATNSPPPRRRKKLPPPWLVPGLAGVFAAVLLALHLGAGHAAKPSSRATPEAAAARDALRRFVSFTKAKYLPVAPDPLLGDVLPEVKGCKLELITREALAARHRGERKTPMIAAVTVQPPAPDAEKPPITVLVALEPAALEGFDETPDGIGREYVYRPTANGVEFLKEQGWIE